MSATGREIAGTVLQPPLDTDAPHRTRGNGWLHAYRPNHPVAGCVLLVVDTDRGDTVEVPITAESLRALADNTDGRVTALPGAIVSADPHVHITGDAS